MTMIRDQIIRIIQINAGKKAAGFAGQYVHSKPKEKEAILAGLDFERWLEQACQDCW